MKTIKNARLKNVFTLSSKVTVYVPSTKNISEQIDNTEYVNQTRQLLSECFGGATSSPSIGSWVSPTEGLVNENTTVVFAYCSDADLQQYADKVIDHCEYLKKELTQDAIALEINGTMYFI